jgi:hypothetical protein
VREIDTPEAAETAASFEGESRSVSRISGLSESEIWPLGNLRAGEGTLRGRAEVAAKEFYNLGLTIRADNDPPRHAHVEGWPEDKLKLAIKLAGLAKLVLMSSF